MLRFLRLQLAGLGALAVVFAISIIGCQTSSFWRTVGQSSGPDRASMGERVSGVTAVADERSCRFG